MQDTKDLIFSAQAGQIIPLVREIEVMSPVEYFAKLSDYGRKKHCCLLESKDHLAEDPTGDLTFATADPALYLTGKGQDFEIRALSAVGRRMLMFFKARPERFTFCSKIDFGEEVIRGSLMQNEQVVDEQSRLKAINQMDVIRAVGFAFELASIPFRVTCGLIGAISYDFVDQFEKLPQSEQDILGNPDYELYFADNLFLMDHKKSKGYALVNVLITDDNREEIYEQSQACFDNYLKCVEMDRPSPRPDITVNQGSDTDTNQSEFMEMVEKAKGHILDGDIFQVVLSRTIIEPCRDEPLDIYRRLRKLNPSPYMFYLNTENTILMGASPELNLRVSGDEPRNVEIRPIAGTKPRGWVRGQMDHDMDVRYEAELKLDRKELAEHMMLVDLARNDIARVAKPATRLVTEMLIAERYESVMHLVSNVKGQLSEDLDALSAYLATMNMGTLTGAPKIEAMKLIRELEKNKRGYYGGAVLYLTVDGQFDSCITIRALQVRDGKAYVRAGAGIVYDSVPKTEYEETQHKARSCLRAIRGEGS